MYSSVGKYPVTRTNINSKVSFTSVRKKNKAYSS